MKVDTIRRATANDLEQILQLFSETIEFVNSKDYLPDQIKVWKNGIAARERWLDKICVQYFLVAEINQSIVGFASITPDGYLDFMYVSKDHLRIGVAQTLYDELEKFAKANHLDKITSDVSITAKPFFEKQGFIIIEEQQAKINEVELTNYKMEKHLNLQ